MTITNSKLSFIFSISVFTACTYTVRFTASTKLVSHRLMVIAFHYLKVELGAITLNRVTMTSELDTVSILRLPLQVTKAVIIQLIMKNFHHSTLGEAFMLANINHYLVPVNLSRD